MGDETRYAAAEFEREKTKRRENVSGLFCLGQVVCTPGAFEAIPPDDITKAIGRHVRGDWGDVGVSRLPVFWAFPRFAGSGFAGLRFAPVACGDCPSGTLPIPNARNVDAGFARARVYLRGDEAPPPEPPYPLLCSGRRKTLPLVAKTRRVIHGPRRRDPHSLAAAACG